MNDVLKKQFEWYEANLDSLLRDYRGKYIAFSENGVIGAYDNQIEGVQGAIDLGHPLGTFAVHLCVPKSEEKPLIFNSRRMGVPNTRFSFRIPSEGVAAFTPAHEVAR